MFGSQITSLLDSSNRYGANSLTLGNCHDKMQILWGINENTADFAGCVESLFLMYLMNNFLQLHGFIVHKTVKQHF